MFLSFLLHFCFFLSDKKRPSTGAAIVVTRIIENGACDLDGRLQLDDIILEVDTVW